MRRMLPTLPKRRLAQLGPISLLEKIAGSICTVINYVRREYPHYYLVIALVCNATTAAFIGFINLIVLAY